MVYLVPFEECETVWIKYLAKVEANTKEEAFKLVDSFVSKNDSPHRTYDCENVEIIEHVASENRFNIEDYSVDDVIKGN